MRVRAKNPIYGMRKAYASYMHIPEYHDYEGDQVQAPKWAEPGTICITTGDLAFPVRMIHPDNIISVDEVAYEPKIEGGPRIVEVKGSRGGTYQVTITKHGRSCTCPGYGFRRSCKHIAEAA